MNVSWWGIARALDGPSESVSSYETGFGKPSSVCVFVYVDQLYCTTTVPVNVPLVNGGVAPVTVSVHLYVPGVTNLRSEL